MPKYLNLPAFTLFLDNAADLDPIGQSTVLRFIEEEKSRALDPRVVSQMHFRIIATRVSTLLLKSPPVHFGTIFFTD